GPAGPAARRGGSAARPEAAGTPRRGPPRRAPRCTAPPAARGAAASRPRGRTSRRPHAHQLGGEAEAHPLALAPLARPGQEEHDAVLAAEVDAGLVAVAHEGEGVDGAEEVVRVGPARAVRRHPDVL